MGVRCPIIVFDKKYFNNIIGDLKEFISNHDLLELQDVFTTDKEAYVKVLALEAKAAEELREYGEGKKEAIGFTLTAKEDSN